jgi:hypothetical protein
VVGRFRHSVVSATAVATIALAAAACTSSGGRMPPAPSGPAHPHSASIGLGAENQTSAAAGERCAFASQALVVKAFRATSVTETVGRSPLGRPTCTFTMGHTNAGAAGVVTLTQTTNAGAHALSRMQASTAGARALSGVADHAFFTARTTTLQFQKKSVIVALAANVRVPGSAPAQPSVVRKDLIRLARLVAAQM